MLLSDIPGLSTYLTTNQAGETVDLLTGEHTTIIYQDHMSSTRTLLSWNHKLTDAEREQIAKILAKGTIMFDSSTRPEQK